MSSPKTKSTKLTWQNSSNLVFDCIVDELRSTLAFEDTCFTDPVDRARQVAGPWSSYVPYGLHPPWASKE
ncbi:unnamed protein product [Penicillium viridicatum]